ncbi:MAG: hypothetical protein QM731_08125 [Chitinophagaceae bacterium]
MKIKSCLPAFGVALTLLSFSANAQSQSTQDSTGLPGDNFSLSGALELFKKSSSPEEFEKLLNNQDNKVNNLDLNGDGDIDYVRVVSKKDGKVNIFVLQAVVSEKESQDIAVIELEQKANENAEVQIIGDEDIYGHETIVEPGAEDGKSFVYPDKNSSLLAHGPHVVFDYSEPAGIIVNVWFWPCVRFVYAPGYVVWVSPWTWMYRPVWWHPWRPYPWHVWHPFYRRPAFVVVHTRRMPRAQQMYRPVRVSSPMVHTRNQANVTRYRNNNPRPGGNNRPGNTRPGNNNNRPGNNNTRPGNTTRPGNNNTRPGNNNSTRPGNTRPTTPATRPTTPATRPGNTRPTTPTTRPTNPSRPATTRPATQQRPQSRPATRPASSGRPGRG